MRGAGNSLAFLAYSPAGLVSPTETAIVATRGRLRPTSADESVPIGRPAALARTWVVDESIHTVPRPDKPKILPSTVSSDQSSFIKALTKTMLSNRSFAIRQL